MRYDLSVEGNREPGASPARRELDQGHRHHEFEGGRIPGLDGLRGLACLAIFGVHFHQKTGLDASFGPFELGRLLTNGNTAVAFFFGLSGFVLSFPRWVEKNTGVFQFNWLRYFVRRFARLAPAYYLCVLALAVKNDHLASWSGQRDTLLHLLFLHNFSSSSFYSISQPLWAIGLFAQFYIVFPLLWTAFASFGSAKTSAAFGLALVVALGAHVFWFSELAKGDLLMTAAAASVALSPVLTHSLLAHLPHFLLGVLAAGLYAGQLSRARGSEALFWGGAVVLLVVLATPMADRLDFGVLRYRFPLVPVLLAAVMVCAPGAPVARGILELRPLRWVGAISYGVYVYHLPIQNISARLLESWGKSVGECWWFFGLASLAGTLVVAALSYHFIERPIWRCVARH